MHLGGWESGDDLEGKCGESQNQNVLYVNLSSIKEKWKKTGRKSRMLCEVGAHRDSSHVMTESKV